MGGFINAQPVLHKFELWKSNTVTEKMSLYWGWTNSFFQARGERALKLVDCLDTMSYEQAIAMIDKHYKDHPEKWSRGLGEQILEALTMSGSPCEGKNPLK